MGNHVHLLIETPHPESRSTECMRFHGRYAQTFNRRHELSGHVFQGRFKAVPIVSDRQLWTAIAYIVNNPVKAGYCARPEDWPWSSHAAVLAGAAPTWLDDRRLFAYLGRAGTANRCERYVELV